MSTSVSEDPVTATVRGQEVTWHFGDPTAEYNAIRNGLGVLDLSGNELIVVRGGGASSALDRLFTKELEYLSYENSTLGLFLDDDGKVVDVATISRRGDDFLIEPSVGGTSSLLAHLSEHLGGGVEAHGLADELQVVALEGPHLWSVADALLETPLTGLPFQGVRPTSFEGVEILGARTGWTGEFGLKFFLPPALVPRFIDAATSRGTLVGQWALELTMLEIRQPVPHRELRHAPTVIEAGWNWLIDLDKDDFLGRDAVEGAAAPDQRTVCFRTGATGISDDALVETTDREVGAVTWAVHHPVLGETLGLARIDAPVAASGLTLGIRDDAGELVAADTVSSPLVTPTSWGMSNSLTGDG